MSHGARVLNTAEWGAGTVTIGAGKMNVETFRQQEAGPVADGK
jgi:hypothetical protein